MVLQLQAMQLSRRALLAAQLPHRVATMGSRMTALVRRLVAQLHSAPLKRCRQHHERKGHSSLLQAVMPLHSLQRPCSWQLMRQQHHPSTARAVPATVLPCSPAQAMLESNQVQARMHCQHLRSLLTVKQSSCNLSQLAMKGVGTAEVAALPQWLLPMPPSHLQVQRSQSLSACWL